MRDLKASLAEGGHIARLAGPLILSQIFQVGIGFTDTVMASRLGTRALAAISIGSSLWFLIYLACIGTLLALSPTVAGLKGAGRLRDIGHWFRQALWLSVFLALLAVPGVRYASEVLPWLRIDAAIVPVVRDYLAAVAWGIPAACLYLAPRFVSDGIGYTRPVMYIQFLALLANAAGNYAFMFGNLGMPALGAAGAGYSTALTLWLSALLMFSYARWNHRYRPLALFSRYEGPALRDLRHLLRLGAPIAGTMIMEVSLFSAVTLLMGSLGTVAVAAHQIALNYSALAFMVPLGLSMAITVRVGERAGMDDRPGARLAGCVGMGMAVSFMTLSALIMVLLPERIVAIYTADPAVGALAAQLLLFAALFQFSDGLQVSALGALRGLKDTLWPALITFGAYWLAGLPLAWVLGRAEALGPQGLWIGLVAGLTFAALPLALRFHWMTRPCCAAGAMEEARMRRD